MPVVKRTARGLQDIKTHSGSVEQTSAPYKAYMRLAHLGMERERKQQEKRSALFRVKTIDERFKEIDTEQRALLGTIRKGKGKKGVSFSGNSPKPGNGERESSFRLKY